MQRSSRQKMIIRALGRHPISVDSLVELTGASPVTIRRDLADLEGQGLLKRVHGGALSANLRGTPMPYAMQAAENAEGKAAIAKCVNELISDNMAVILDNGSTMVAVAEALRGRPISALCLSVRSAFALGESRLATVSTPAGTVAAESLRYTGAACLTALEGYRADVVVVGACSALPTTGLTVATFEDAQVKKAAISVSSRAILAATGDKLGRTSSFKFGSFDDLDDLVTTPDAPDSILDAVREAGVQVHIAQ